jgi:hypothetical protein
MKVIIDAGTVAASLWPDTDVTGGLPACSRLLFIAQGNRSKTLLMPALSSEIK